MQLNDEKNASEMDVRKIVLKVIMLWKIEFTQNKNDDALAL